MLRKLWRSDELIWIPSQCTKETNNAGMMTLATRLGLEEQTFAMLKKRSGCTKFGSWNKLLGTAVTTYDAKYHRITWVALGTHLPGPNGWEKSPNYFYDRAMSCITAECSNPNLNWLDKAFIPPTPVKLPKNICGRCTSASNQAGAVPATKNTSVDRLCIGLCSERVDYFGNINSNYCLSKWDYARGSWRSKDCSSVAVKGKMRCRSCISSRSNINRRNHPKLFDDPIMTSILPDLKSCDDHLRNLYESTSAEEFMNSPNVTKIAKLMKIVLPENSEKTTPLCNEKKFVVCNGNDDECLHFAVLSEKCLLHQCLPCKLKRSNEKKREKRKELELSSPEPDKRIKPGSRCNFRYLTPDDQTARLRKLNDGRKRNSARMKEMKLRLTLMNESFNKDDDPELLSCVKSALAEVDGKQQDFKKALLAAIMENEITSNGNNCSKGAITEEDYAEFVSQVMTEMKNFSLRISNKVSLCGLTQHFVETF